MPAKNRGSQGRHWGVARNKTRRFEQHAAFEATGNGGILGKKKEEKENNDECHSYSRAVFSSIHKFVFAVLLVTLLSSAMPSPTTRQAGVSVGSTVLLMSASDHFRQTQNLDTLMGSKGLLFVFNRSVDW